MSTLIVIPAFNEADNIDKVVRRAQAYAPVCIINDASTDRTAEILTNIPNIHVVTHSRNEHIGSSVLDGMSFALQHGFDSVVTMDAGFSHSPADIPNLLNAGTADLVLGSRSTGSNWHAPMRRKLLTRSASLLMNRAMRRGRRASPARLGDCSSGFRRYSRRAIELLHARPIASRSFGFPLESLGRIAAAGLSIHEVPISYRATDSSLDTKAILDAIQALWRVRLGKA